jgi:RNA-directed DNA polymerase
MTNEEMTKSLPISKRMVWESYGHMKSKRGGAGIDGETIERFDKNMSGNLYKLWNRLSSGSYFPPAVKTVFIPKKDGGQRPLGIPTVSDRIAQGVVKAYLEPNLDVKFVESSYGYRPKKNAHQAVERCQTNCRNKAWVLDIDIKGFFDAINHELLLEMLAQETQEKWVMLYVERWLKAGVEQADGSILGRTKGTPQGGVISPLLANLYLHNAFDTWMQKYYPSNEFERYADDIVIHCETEKEAQDLQAALKERLLSYDLELHPLKTKIVYCKNYLRKGRGEHRSFTFLGFSFQPKMLKSKVSGQFLAFRAVVSGASKQNIRTSLKAIIGIRRTNWTIERHAQTVNSKIRGWLNYYSKIEKWGISRELSYVNVLLLKWIRNKYRTNSKGKCYDKLRQFQTEQPNLFVHWTFGILT